jgi:histidinol-phosphatase (PHP family)
MIVSYHNHTCWSDGQYSLQQMIDGARQAGVDEFGISDHFVLTPNLKKLWWSMPLDFLDEYVARVCEAIVRTEDLHLRLGLEADYLPETIDDLRDLLAPHPFDYLIGSVHIVDGFSIDYQAADWEPLSQSEINDIWRLYWVRVREMAHARLFDFAGHLDLPKKFGFLPTVDLTAEISAALDALAAAGMAIEINTAGWDKPIGEAYPSPLLLQEAHRRGIPLVINADAHMPEHVTNHYDRARSLARSAGYTQALRYDRRIAHGYQL